MRKPEKRGNSYRIKITLTLPDGQKVNKSVTAPTEKECVSKAYELEAALKKKHDYTDPTLRRCYERYIEDRAATLSPTTLREYNRELRIGYPTLMDLHVSQITKQMIQAATNKYASTLSAKTVRNKHGLLYAVLKYYDEDFPIQTRLPEWYPDEVIVPEIDEIKTLYEHVKGTDMEIPFLLATQLGLRESEIAGLEPSAVDAKRNEIKIKEAKVRGEYGQERKKPKSRAGMRTLPCAPEIIEKILASETFFDGHLTGHIIQSRWEHIRHACGLDHICFHHLRHYFASRALLEGVPIQYVARLMGHSSEAMLQRVYAHCFKDAERVFALKLTTLYSELDAGE